MWIIFIALSCIGSYLSVYQPQIFSSNIHPLGAITSKLIIVAIAVGISFFWICHYIPLQQSEILLLSIELVLLQIACIDGYSKIIPNRLLLVLLFLISLQITFHTIESDWIIISVISGSIISIQVVIKQLLGKYIVGWGDIKLMLVLTLLYEQKLILILVTSFIIAGVGSLLLIIIDKKYLKLKIPLSPFFVGTIFVLSKEINWNIHFFLMHILSI